MVIETAHVRLSDLYTTIDRLEREFAIETFGVSQTTLEHVFVAMVRDQL
jgi:hypothetical protein